MSWIIMLLLIHAIVGKPTEEEEDYPDYEHSIGIVLCSEGFTMGTNGCEEIEIVEIEPFICVSLIPHYVIEQYRIMYTL